MHQVHWCLLVLCFRTGGGKKCVGGWCSVTSETCIHSDWVRLYPHRRSMSSPLHRLYTHTPLLRRGVPCCELRTEILCDIASSQRNNCSTGIGKQHFCLLECAISHSVNGITAVPASMKIFPSIAVLVAWRRIQRTEGRPPRGRLLLLLWSMAWRTYHQAGDIITLSARQSEGGNDLWDAQE